MCFLHLLIQTSRRKHSDNQAFKQKSIHWYLTKDSDCVWVSSPTFAVHQILTNVEQQRSQLFVTKIQTDHSKGKTVKVRNNLGTDLHHWWKTTVDASPCRNDTEDGITLLLPGLKMTIYWLCTSTASKLYQCMGIPLFPIDTARMMNTLKLICHLLFSHARCSFGKISQIWSFPILFSKHYIYYNAAKIPQFHSYKAKNKDLIINRYKNRVIVFPFLLWEFASFLW